MLRGPQTVAELRASSERLHRFADIPAIEAVLLELPTATRRARCCCRVHPAPASRAGAPALRRGAADGAARIRRRRRRPDQRRRTVALKGEIARQGAELAELRALVQRMAAELGIAADPTS